MNRAQLERLGAETLRRLARQIRLPGALHHSKQELITGLCAYFERRPHSSEDDEEPGEGSERPGGLPPALATETMARVLEAQGKADEAATLRQRLARESGRRAPPEQDEVELVHVGSERVTVRYRLTSHLPDAQLQVWFWTRRGPPVIRRQDLTTDEGRWSLEPPAGALLICAILGHPAPEQVLDPLCRTPILALGAPQGTGAAAP
jgi:hypothetical protein